MQVIGLSLEKIWGKEDFFCTNPPHSTPEPKENNNGEMVP